MLSATLKGSVAENSHVRLDEGNVASPKPRRGALLYLFERSCCRVRSGGGRLVLAGALALTAATACAENLYFNPQNTDASCAGDKDNPKKFGNKIYYADNWTNAQGVATLPKENDVLYVRVHAGMTCNGGSQVTAGLGGFFIKNNSMAINQGTLYLKGGGLGFVEQDTGRTRPLYGTLMAKGPGVVPVTIPYGDEFNVQGQISGDNGAVIEKRGAGTLALIDGSNWSSDNRSTLSSFVIKSGQVAWRPTGSRGEVNPSIQIFPQNHTLVFADDGSSGAAGCSFNIGARDVDMINLTLREEATVTNPKHVFTSLTNTPVYLRMTGTPGLNPMGFGGSMINNVGLSWNPTANDNEFVFSNSVSTTKGGLRVLNGSMRLTKGATFTQLSLLEVASGRSFTVEAGAGGGFSAKKLVLGDATASVSAGRNVILSFNAAEVGGVAVADGVYTSADLGWIKGEGRVRIGSGSLVDTDIYWERADGPTELAANSITNYLGVRLSGEPLSFTAGAGAQAFVGAGGFSTSDDKSRTYTWGWPVVIDGANTVFDIKWSDVVSFTEDISTTAGTKILLDGGGYCQFVGAKNITGDMEVTNGTIIAVGDDSVGTVGGKTTFHLTAYWLKGKLVIRTEPGKNVVSFHRPMDFHYWVTGDHQPFLYFPENATVNFYGLMQTTVSPLKPGCNGWPCHWAMSCPSTTVVNWYGGMYAALNHIFPGGTHNIWKALTGGDRFGVGEGATVNLHVTGNRIGAATGNVKGRVNCLAPYALDSRSANQVMVIQSGNAVVDLGGYDQALSIFSCNSSNFSNAKVTSETPALLRITGGYTIDSTPSYSMTNFVQFVGGAGLSRDCDAASYPLVLRNTSSSTGMVQVTKGLLKLAAPNAQGNWAGKWPNASAAVVSGGKLVLEHKAAIGTNTVMRLSGSGKVELPAGVRVKVPSLEINGVAQQTGIYGSTASGATFQDDTHFVGAGTLRVGRIGACILLR